MVQRYDDMLGTKEARSGFWVRHSDYLALKIENEAQKSITVANGIRDRNKWGELARENEVLKELLAEAGCVIGGCIRPHDDLWDRIDAIVPLASPEGKQDGRSG